MQVKHFANSGSKQPHPQTSTSTINLTNIPTPAASNSSTNGTTPNTNSSSSHHSTSHAGAIAGGTVGGICGLALLALLAYLLLRSRTRRAAAAPKNPPNGLSEMESDQPTPQQPYPFELKEDGRALEMQGAGLHELSDEQRLEIEGTKVNELPGDVRAAELRGEGVERRV